VFAHGLGLHVGAERLGHLGEGVVGLVDLPERLGVLVDGVRARGPDGDGDAEPAVDYLGLRERDREPLGQFEPAQKRHLRAHVGPELLAVVECVLARGDRPDGRTPGFQLF
jgi:hypothetical protein